VNQGRDGGKKGGRGEAGRKQAQVLTPSPLPPSLLSFLPPFPDMTPPPPFPPTPPLSIFEKALLLSHPPSVGEDTKAEEARLRSKGDIRWRAMVKQLVEVRKEGGKEGGRSDADRKGGEEGDSMEDTRNE